MSQPERKKAGANPANPGIGAVGNWAFTDGKRTWQESMNLVDSLSAVLKERGHTCTIQGPIVTDVESQLSLRPLLWQLTPAPGAPQTATTIEITHATRIPSPIFEFQHASGPSLDESFYRGFCQWYDGDFAALRDAVRDKAVECQEMGIAPHDDTSAVKRVTFGPTLHFRPPDAPPLDTSDPHPFCPCCLLTNSISAFDAVLRMPGFHALRLLALRGPTGNFAADCRVDGEDHAAGKQALIDYAKTWKTTGVDSRKQYVIIQDVPV